MNEYPFTLERSIVICAERSTVFSFFTDSKRFADWWGPGSEVEGYTGGAVRIRFPNGIAASGQILEIEPENRIVFTYGFDSGKPMPAGSSRVTITLKDHSDGTLLTLVHELDDEMVRDEHVQGWRFQLSLFANAAARIQHANLQERIDAYFDIWNQKDATVRRSAMDVSLSPGFQFHDMFSCTTGPDDLNAHITASHFFMPGLTIKRAGDAHLCQSTAVCNWTATKTDGSDAGKGTNVFTLSSSGLFRSVTGFWMR